MSTREKIRNKETQIRILEKEIQELKENSFDGIYLDDYLEAIKDFNKKLAKTLASYNINTVEQLLTIPRNSILEIPNIGPTNLKTIEDWIEKHGVYLRCC